MDFVIVSYQDIYAANGSAKFVRQFESMHRFVESGINVRIYSNGKKLSNESVHKERSNYKQKIQNILNKSFLGSLANVYIRYNMNAKKVIARMQSNEKDWKKSSTVYLFNDVFSLYYFDKRIGIGNKRCMLILHNDGNIFKMLGLNHPKLKKMFSCLEEKKVFKNRFNKLEKIIFVCEKAKENFLKNYPEFRDKAETIYIGGEIQQGAAISEDKIRMVTVGSVNARKNQFGIIQAMEKIGDSSIELTIVGNGSDLEKCKNFVLQKSMKEQVHFVGEQKDIFPYLKNANLFVMFSNDEGLPISAQEAMSCGIPLLLTDVGGCKELIDENGMVIPVEESSLVEAIKYLNDNKRLLKDMGYRSKNLYDEKFSLETMFEQYCNLIKF